MPINLKEHSAVNPLLIAGPCAAESREQLLTMAADLSYLGVQAMRASLFKPRTEPGWEGVGFELGGDWFAELVAQNQLAVATEVTSAADVQTLVKKLAKVPGNKQLIVWLGSRLQFQTVQSDVGRALRDCPEDTLLLIKNQPWGDQRHWEGILQHVNDGAQFSQGELSSRVAMIHRGFSPYKLANPEGFRNLPDFEMAMKVKQNTGVKMILDPSHIAGTRANVFKIVQQVSQDPNLQFDGFMVEVHDKPASALTDAKQQLSIPEFMQLLEEIHHAGA